MTTLDLETGDILLFSDTTFIFSRIIEYVTGTPFSHVALAWVDPILDGKLHKGVFVFESTGLSDIPDIEDGKLKFGVQVRPLDDVVREYKGRVWMRKLRYSRSPSFEETFRISHDTIKGVTYDLDPRDWFRVLFDIKIGDTQKTNEMYCSALVGYVYDRLGLIQDPHMFQWTLARPCDFSSTYSPSRIPFDDTCVLDVDVQIK
jgi:hypothetical protein